jgi:hypothetical protein
MVIGFIRIALVHVPLQALYIVAKKVGSISRSLDTSHWEYGLLAQVMMYPYGRGYINTRHDASLWKEVY